MLPTIMKAVRKPGRLLSVVPVGLALLFVALPTYAASPEVKGAQAPDATCPAGGQCFADVPSGNSFYTFVNRIYRQDLVTGYPCGGPGEPCDAENRPYYRPGGLVTRQQMSKFIDQARRLPQISIEGDSLNALIFADNGSNGIGISGSSSSSTGVRGSSSSNLGVHGYSVTNVGVRGESNDGTGIFGTTNIGSGNWAGYFTDNVHVTGNLSKGGGSFKIDHPLDPANKYLYHSFVESPDMMNIYNGNAILDSNGEAWIEMPEWFSALNRDFRYQLTAIGGPGPNLYIAQKMEGNRFKIAGGSPGMEVSWMVTGIRQDPYANAHRIPVEEDKTADEKGKYVHPTEWGQPESAGIDYEEQQKMQETMQQKGER